MELGCRELRRRLGGLFTPGYVAAVSAVRLWRTTLTGRQTERARAALARLTEAAVAAYRAGDESTAAGRLRALGLDEAQARGAVGLFLLTGTETLVSFVPRLVALAHDTGRGPDGITDALVEEALRVTSPTPVMLRSAARAGRIGGVRVASGARGAGPLVRAAAGARPRRGRSPGRGAAPETGPAPPVTGGGGRAAGSPSGTGRRPPPARPPGRRVGRTDMRDALDQTAAG
ncbi:hypothetical protein ACIQF5_05840 [Streptomyces goshikiensis]|uniref:hypothetical protein n=1 Tax=Streptomyces goshikiensis TaxID=1942 RepID=UPI00381D9A4A